MAVTKDAISAGVLASTGIATLAAGTFGLTIGATATFLLVGFEVDSATPSSVNWDPAGTNQPMTLIGTVAAGTTSNIALFGLVNPTPGNKSISFTATANNSAYIFGISFTGSETSSVAAATEGFNKATGTGTSFSVVTSASIPSGDAAVSALGNSHTITGFPSDGGTSIGLGNSLTTNLAGENYSGAGSAITASASSASSGQWAYVIVGIAAPGGGAFVPDPRWENLGPMLAQ